MNCRWAWLDNEGSVEEMFVRCKNEAVTKVTYHGPVVLEVPRGTWVRKQKVVEFFCQVHAADYAAMHADLKIQLEELTDADRKYIRSHPDL